jgi:sugar-specific transcriptional regulator TrmB
MARIDRDELRSMVRQALKETLGAKGDAPSEGPSDLASDIKAALARGKPAKVKVAADLDAFARGILAAGEDAALKAAIRAGDVRFEIAGGAERTNVKTVAKGGSFHMESGVLGETKLVELARSHSKIVVGSDVVVTPLAREKARQLKVEIARQKP